jgi:hypothetical protein
MATLLLRNIYDNYGDAGINDNGQQIFPEPCLVEVHFIYVPQREG